MEASEVLLILLALVLGAVAGYVLGRRTASPSPQSDGDRLALTDARQDAATARAEASRAREEAALTKAEVAQIPEDHVLFCGLAIGWPDPEAPVNSFANARAPLAESARFLD